MSHRQGSTVAAAVERAHRAWCTEVDEALDRVRAPEADIWERSAAVHYLIDQFSPRLDREARFLTGLGACLPAEQRGRIWALGELLQLLCRHLCELGAMPQCGPAFATAVGKLSRALHCWCREVELAVGAAEAEGLAPGTRERFEDLLAESAALPA